jgi:hypothetical protein
VRYHWKKEKGGRHPEKILFSKKSQFFLGKKIFPFPLYLN